MSVAAPTTPSFIIRENEPTRNLSELVKDLQSELKKGKNLDNLYNIMMSYDYTLNEWKKFQYWDEKKKYTRNLIATDDETFTLMLLCWNPTRCSPIHSHAGSECFMRCVSGQVKEIQYVIKEGSQSSEAPDATDLEKVKAEVYNAGQCAFINDSLGLHKVENPFDTPAVTLHCYIPPYFSCQSFDAEDDVMLNGQTLTDVVECDEEMKKLMLEKQKDSQAKPVLKAKVKTCHISFDTEHGEKCEC